jgi:hypothetical protein
MTDRDTLLEAAHRIGRRVAGQARWSGGACTWTVMRPDRSDPAHLKPMAVTGGGTVYSGTAGIALFLLELPRATGDSEIGRAAEGAVRWALADPDVHSTPFGFYSGRVGVAYAAARAGRADLAEEARRFLAPLAAYRAQPEVFTTRRRLEALESALADIRQLVLLPHEARSRSTFYLGVDGAALPAPAAR